MIIFAVSIFVGTVVGLVLAIAVVIYFLRMLREVRPGVSPWGLHVFYNPLNVLFRPNLLTDRGLMWRRRLGISIALFLAVSLAVFLLVQL
jgi:hypothetical protein